jgi:hypothetical protein
MIEFMHEGNGNVVGIRASRRLTDADYRHVLIPRLQSRFEQFGTLRVLFLMDETFTGWDPRATWHDTVLNLRHRADLERIVIVGGPRCEQWCAKLTGRVMKGELRTFRRGQLSEAWAWIGSAGA